VIAALRDWVLAAPVAFLAGIAIGFVVASRYRIVRAGSQEPQTTHHTAEVYVMSEQTPINPEADPTAPEPEQEPGTDPQPDRGNDDPGRERPESPPGQEPEEPPKQS
jgi:hypothetical protein